MMMTLPNVAIHLTSVLVAMSESRSTPRSNVSWRAAILLAAGNIIPAKIVNFSGSGIQLQCDRLLKDGQTYQLMMEVPGQKDASERTQVSCKVTCLYALLSGSEYRAGLTYFDVLPQHQALLHGWGGRIAVTAD